MISIKFLTQLRVWLCTIAILLGTGLTRAGAASAEDAPPKVTYVDHVQPIFRQHCFACHGPDTKKNDLALNTYAAAMAGGASGEVVSAGDADGSYLWMLVNHDVEPAMPPGGAKLPQAELDVIRNWIAGGLLEKSDSVARKPKKAAVAAFTPTADNRPDGEPAMPTGLLREPVIHAPRSGAPTALAASPWAPLAAVGAPFQIVLYHTDSGELLGVLPFTEGNPNSLEFSRDGGLLLASGGKAGSRGVAALFDVKSGRRLATVGDELDAVLAADLRADHSLIALGGPRKVVRVYRVSDGSLAYEITKHTDWITSIEFSPDGKLLATGDRSGGLLLWDAETGRERGDLRGHVDQITGISWRGDSAVLASASEDDNAKLWKVADATQIKSWVAHGQGVESIEFARSGELTTAGRDQLVKMWKADGAHLRDVATLDDMAMSARFTHDGKRIVAGDWRGNVRILQAEDGKVAATLDPNPPTLDARLAAVETEVNQLRQTAQEAAELLASSQAQVAAAEKALEQARADAQAKSQMHTEHVAKLGTAEQRLATVAAEKAAYLKATAEIAQLMNSTAVELAAAEAAAKAKQAEREASQAELAKQQAVVAELAAKLAELQKQLDEAKTTEQTLAGAHTAKENETAEADGRAAELAGRIEELQRRQAELDEIQKLRERYTSN